MLTSCVIYLVLQASNVSIGLEPNRFQNVFVKRKKYSFSFVLCYVWIAIQENIETGLPELRNRH